MKRDPVAPVGMDDFSLVLGGPLFQLFRRWHLSDDALELLLTRRIIVLALFCWLPLFVLSLVEHHLLPGSTTVPFLLDIEAQVRFLVALPLLIAAELIVHRRLSPLVAQFRTRDLIPESELPRYEAALASAHRLRNSLPAELVLMAVVFGVGILVAWNHYIVLDASTWYMTGGPEAKLTLAGMWFRYVSLPVFQFLFLRWYFRLFVWTRFLWQVSRIQLKLVPTHPDRAGGIGFLSGSVLGFVPLLMGQGAMLAGQIANRIYFLGAKLPEFKWEILALVVLAVSSVFAPLLVFVLQLARARRRGMREYGTLAQGYVRDFDHKWLRGAAPAEETFLGSADIQSLADLGNSFEVVQGMRISLISRGTVLQLAILTVTPFVPLLLTMMPLEDLLKTLFGMLF